MTEKKSDAQRAVEDALENDGALTLAMIRELIADLDEDDRLRLFCIATVLRRVIANDRRLAPLAFAWVASEMGQKLATKN